MIVSIASDIPTFKRLRFGRGLNVLLADVTVGSTEGQTRNSAGKSSLLEIVHFLTGGDDKQPLFRVPEIRDRSFTGTFVVRGRAIRVTRRCAAPGRLWTSPARARRLGIPLSRDDDTGEVFVSIEDWKDFLGTAWFGLPKVRVGTPFEAKFAPTLRSLFGYFARRSRDLGFAHIDRYFAKQPAADAQAPLSYLLGLDWRIPREMRELRERTENLTKARSAIADSGLSAMFGTSAKIRPELARMEQRVERLKRESETFQVLESYREQAAEAASLRSELSRLAIEMSTARETLAHMERLLADEKPPAYAAVQTLYQAAGIELPGVALKRFEEVERFQASVVENRRGYLREQVEETRSNLADIEARSSEVDQQRSKILRQLNGKGAFEDLVRIQEELGQASSRAETLRQMLHNANILENKTVERRKQVAEMELRLRADYEANEEAIKAATVLADAAIAALYDDRAGNLVIEPTRKGPVFTLSIGGGGNQGGIDQMKVFCFDMMLMERTWALHGGPEFLIHDSHLFDGVDPRQARAALLLGREVALRTRGQYIVMLNSDKFRAVDQPPEPDLEAAVLPVCLTDDEHGGLFGFRFELPGQGRVAGGPAPT